MDEKMREIRDGFPVAAGREKRDGFHATVCAGLYSEVLESAAGAVEMFADGG